MTETPHRTRLGLLRHALTEWNREGRIQGQTDTPLSPLGESQAEQWGSLLKAYPWDRILASNARRALETAGKINAFLNVPMSTDPRLWEQDWGDWTGKTLHELEQGSSRLLWEQEKAGWKFRPPGGEDRLAVLDRAYRALVEAGEKWPGHRILVVAHEGVIKCLLYHFCGRSFLPGEPVLIQPRTLHWLVHDRQGLGLEAVNAISLDG